MSKTAEIIEFKKDKGMDDLTRLESGVNDLRGDVKELREAITELVRVDEKVINLMRASEQNSEDIQDLKKLVSEIDKNQGVNTAIDKHNSRILFWMLSSVVIILAAIIGEGRFF